MDLRERKLQNEEPRLGQKLEAVSASETSVSLNKNCTGQRRRRQCLRCNELLESIKSAQFFHQLGD